MSNTSSKSSQLNFRTEYTFSSPLCYEDTMVLLRDTLLKVGRLLKFDITNGYLQGKSLCLYDDCIPMRELKMEFSVKRTECDCKVDAVIYGFVVSPLKDAMWNRFVMAMQQQYLQQAQYVPPTSVKSPYEEYGKNQKKVPRAEAKETQQEKNKASQAGAKEDKQEIYKDILRFIGLLFKVALVLTPMILVFVYKIGSPIYSFLFWGFLAWIWMTICISIMSKVSSKKIEDMSGYEYEEFVAQRLREEGYHKVKVTQKSGDYGADIIAVDKKGRKTAIQCKKYKKPVGIKAVQEVNSARLYYNCDRAIVITNSTFTPNAKELAKSNKVDLIENFI